MEIEQEKFGYSSRKSTLRPASEIYFVVKIIFFFLKEESFPLLQLIQETS